LSARLKFLKEWPAAASYLFDEALINFDCEGLSNDEDRKKRSELEALAEEKYELIRRHLSEFEESSVEKGVMQAEYVEGLVKDLGRDLALCVYSTYIVDKFMPSKDKKPKISEASEGGIQPIDLAPPPDAVKTAPEPVPELPPAAVIENTQTTEEPSKPASIEESEEDFMVDDENDPLAHIKPIDMSAPPPGQPEEESSDKDKTSDKP